MTKEPLWYELINLVFCKEFARAEGLLAADPCLFDLCNSIGETVLHFLAVENDIEGVAWLHARGFSLNTKNRFGEPMVFEVAMLGRKELLLWLSQDGADLFALDAKERNILDYLRKNKDEKRKRKRKRKSKSKSKSEEIVQFLVRNIPGLTQIGASEK